MRIIRLLGILFLVGAAFAFTRAAGWHIGYLLAGGFLLIFGIVFLTPEQRRAQATASAARKPIVARPGRVRSVPTSA